MSSSNNLDYAVMLKAVKRCLVEKCSTKSTGEMFEIPRSTLRNYLKKVEAAFGEIHNVYDDVLLKFIREAGQHVPSNQVI